jgi:molecular chaperone DnaK
MATKKEQKIVVTPAGGLTDREIAEIIEDAERHAEDDKKRAELFRIQARLEGLLESNMRSFAEFGSMLDEEKRVTVKKIIDAARKALASASISECTESLEKLGEASQILTEVILYQPSAGAPGNSPGGGGKTGAGEASGTGSAAA